MNNANIIKLLQIRKFRKNLGFISHYKGPILTKSGLNRDKSKSLRKIFQEDAVKFNWKAPPRARIAISFKIFCSQQNPPEIYNIIKYYLDLLNDIVFKDDKQVHYLETSLWKSISKEPKSSIYIQARHLIDMFKIWDIYQKADIPSNEYNDENSLNFLHLINQDLWNMAEQQYDILRKTKISQYDRPGLKKHSSPTMMNRFCGMDPFIFDLGHLPSKGESKMFLNNIRDMISMFRSRYSIFQTIYFPLELDIQITRTGLKQLKDLDNIAMNICREFSKCILHDKVYINGYRINFVDDFEDKIKTGIRLKLLPPGEIELHNNRMEKAITNIEEKLSDNNWF